MLGYSWAAYGPPKTSHQPRAWLVPSPVSGTISRCCGRKDGGCSWGAKAHGARGRLSGVGEPRGPAPPCRVLVLAPGHSTWLFLCTSVFPPEIASHDSAFPNIKVFGSLPRVCSGGVHASPIISLLLQRASRSWGTSTTQPKTPPGPPPPRARGTRPSVPLAKYSSPHLEP